MKCPYCGEEMEKGKITSIRAIYFDYDTEKPSVLNPKRITISKNNRMHPDLVSYICGSCKKIIADLTE